MASKAGERKVVQLVYRPYGEIFTPTEEREYVPEVCMVVCDDGTMWERARKYDKELNKELFEWYKMENPPLTIGA